MPTVAEIPAVSDGIAARSIDANRIPNSAPGKHNKPVKTVKSCQHADAPSGAVVGAARCSSLFLSRASARVSNAEHVGSAQAGQADDGPKRVGQGCHGAADSLSLRAAPRHPVGVQQHLLSCQRNSVRPHIHTQKGSADTACQSREQDGGPTIRECLRAHARPEPLDTTYVPIIEETGTGFKVSRSSSALWHAAHADTGGHDTSIGLQFFQAGQSGTRGSDSSTGTVCPPGRGQAQ